MADYDPENYPVLASSCTYECLKFNNFMIVLIADYYRRGKNYRYGYDYKDFKKYCEDVLQVTFPTKLTNNDNVFHITFYKNVIGYVDIYDPVKYTEFTDYIDQYYNVSRNTVYWNVDKYEDSYCIPFVLLPVNTENIKYISASFRERVNIDNFITSEEVISIRDLVSSHNDETDSKPARTIPSHYEK